MVEKQDWAVDAAIGVFSNARAPGIYKSDYILELFKRYDEEENAFEAPPLPDWCFEDADQDDTDLGRAELSGETKGDAKKPFIPDFDISGVSLVKQPQICRQVTGKAAEWIETKVWVDTNSNLLIKRYSFNRVRTRAKLSSSDPIRRLTV